MRRTVLGTFIILLCLFIQAEGNFSSALEAFLPPPRLRIPMKTAYRQVNDAGPPEPYPRSKASLELPFLFMDEELASNILVDIKEGMRYVFQTRNEWTFALHGTGHTGCHAVLDNLIETGDRVLVFVIGFWSDLMAEMAERLGAEVIRVEKPPGTVFSLEEIKMALRMHQPDLVLLVHAETSTTVTQPLAGIGDLCEKNKALLVVDTVASAAIQPILMDYHKIDATFTTSYKGLGSSAGLTPVSLSPRAVQKIKSRKTRPRAYQTDLVIQNNLWNTSDPVRITHQGISLPLLYGLREALATIVEEGIENVFHRHKEVTSYLMRGLTALWLEPYVENPQTRLVAFTSVKAPQGKDLKKVVDYMFKKHNIAISSGVGPTAGKMLRFTTFANNADFGKISNILVALRSALAARETDV